ncbi:MAG: hypothetical protein AMJ90_05070 [candidate division Zixibacteria bacterium SM23_73_2]|nr:MAG: hypothetical protein AMJ90_05070 [candidate division Zixibacteria bacterium SM23_73_2]
MIKKVLILGWVLFFATGAVFSISAFSAEKEYYTTEDNGWLGVYIENVDWDMREALDLESDEGVLIAEVVDDSPAEKAGLKAGDVVVFFNKSNIEDVDQFVKLVRKTKPGERSEITVIRDGDKKQIFVKMGKKPKKDLDYTIIEKKKEKKDLKPWFYGMRISSMGSTGMEIQDLTEQLGEYFGVKDGKGALVTEVEENGPAHKADLKAGDVIVRVGGESIDDCADFWEKISEKEKGDRVKIEVLRKGDRKNFTLRIEEEEKKWFSQFFPEVPKVPEIKKIIVPEKKILKEPLKEKIWEKELREEMKELKEQLNELKEELKELREELY